ncbi:MAG: hypothetical protein WA254_13345 [Candidatus Sulfotelmatobacter sp.]
MLLPLHHRGKSNSSPVQMTLDCSIRQGQPSRDFGDTFVLQVKQSDYLSLDLWQTVYTLSQFNIS